MINANELRIGNYVYRQWEKMTKQEDGERSSLYQIENVNLQSARKYDPIPLTEELIIQICSDKNQVMGMYRLWVTDDYHISFSLDNDMIYIGDDIEIKISRTPLHRFQNLFFALTGIELTLKQQPMK